MSNEKNRPAGTAVMVGSVTAAATLLDNAKEQITGLLPAGANANRFAKVVLQSIRQNPALRSTTQSSFVSAALQCAQLGLEPARGQAYLIPRKIKGTLTAMFQLGYQGKKELAYRSGKYSLIESHVVRDGDDFRYSRGLSPDIHHVPALVPEIGDMTHVYSIAWPKEEGARPIFEVMTRVQVDAIRARSSSATDGPWVTDYDEMARKTVFSRLAKWLDLTPEAFDAFERDAVLEYGKGADVVLGHKAMATLEDELAGPAEMAQVLEEEEATDPEPQTASKRLAKALTPEEPKAEPKEQEVPPEVQEARQAERERQKALLKEQGTPPPESPPHPPTGAPEASATPDPDPTPTEDPQEAQEGGEPPVEAPPSQTAKTQYPVRTHQGTTDEFPLWVGDFPKVSDLGGTLARIKNPLTIAEMWYRDSRGTASKAYYDRLLEFPEIEDPEAILARFIPAEG